MSQNEMFEIEASDEESYFEPGTHYREVNGHRVWEPKGEIIAELYQKIEKNGCFDDSEFDWKNPGRISPSKLKEANNGAEETATETVDSANKAEEKEKTEFDFGADFDDEPAAIDAKVVVKNRPSQGK